MGLWFGATHLNMSTLDNVLTSFVSRTTSSAGLEVILALKPLKMGAMESKLSDSLRWELQI